MAYAMANSDITSVLVGARTTGHIDNALEALDMGLDEGLRSEMSSWPE
jgi:aryl-alcohol dehydrogenase-like predicted oxidoreductase